MSRTAAPTNARSQRTRASLLDAARAIIEADGPASLTMADAAQRAGVTRRAVYLHFATRADLMIALFEHVATTEDLQGALRPVWQAVDAAAALDAWVAAMTGYLLRIADVAGALYRERRSDPDIAAHWEVVSREHRADCLRLAEKLARTGPLPAPWTVATAADMMWASMSYGVLDHLIHDCGWTPSACILHLQALLKSALVPLERASAGSRGPAIE